MKRKAIPWLLAAAMLLSLCIIAPLSLMAAAGDPTIKTDGEFGATATAEFDKNDADAKVEVTKNDGDFTFLGIMRDGAILVEGYIYTIADGAEEGTEIITFSNDYLSGLPTEAHEFIFIYEVSEEELTGITLTINITERSENPTLSITETDFDVNDPYAVRVIKYDNDFTFSGITSGEVALVKDTDYTVSGDGNETITFSNDYLSDLLPDSAISTNIVFTFVYEGEKAINPTLTVTVWNSTATLLNLAIMGNNDKEISLTPEFAPYTTSYISGSLLFNTTKVTIHTRVKSEGDKITVYRGVAKISEATATADAAVIDTEVPLNTGTNYIYVTVGDEKAIHNRYTVSIFRQNSGGGGGGSSSTSSTYYSISRDTMTNGNVTADKYSAISNTKVTLTAKPDPGYIVDSITVTDKNDNSITVTKSSDNIYTFYMPTSNVTINATFVSDGETEDPTIDDPTEPTEPSRLPFVDVQTSDWFYNAVIYAYENGLLNGTSETTFGPTDTTTRAMLVTVLWRVDSQPAAGLAETYADVQADAYYAEAVNWASANEIVSGYGNGFFGSDDPVTREQMVSILYRYTQFKGYSVDSSFALDQFTDAALVSDWAVPAMQWAVATGLINGRDDGTVDPQGNATRAEVSTILQRIIENVLKNAVPALAVDEAVTEEDTAVEEDGTVDDEAVTEDSESEENGASEDDETASDEDTTSEDDATESDEENTSDEE